MGSLSVIAAAAAAWGLGAVYYMVLSGLWMRAAGVKAGPDGRPEGMSSPIPFILSALCMVLVAGMMRHVFATSGIVTWDKAVLTGLGVGAFFIAPWIMINNAYAMRPFRLTLIDGGYAVLGCAVIGFVLSLFSGS